MFIIAAWLEHPQQHQGLTFYIISQFFHGTEVTVFHPIFALFKVIIVQFFPINR